jgi:hypothetical protein
MDAVSPKRKAINPKTARRCRALSRDATWDERIFALARRVLPSDQLTPLEDLADLPDEEWTQLWVAIGMALAATQPEFRKGPGRNAGRGGSSDSAAVRKRRSRYGQDLKQAKRLWSEILELEDKIYTAGDRKLPPIGATWTPLQRLRAEKIREHKKLRVRLGIEDP